MKKILSFLLISLFTINVYSQKINISLDYSGLINEPVMGEITPVSSLEIGDEFYLDITINNSDNSLYTVTYADIWLTFKNDAFEYLGIDNSHPNGNWYTYQWPSTYIFHNSTTAEVDDLYGQYNTDHYWEYVDDELSDNAPMVITSQTVGELDGVVARLKFKYKQVPNGFDFTNSVILRKAEIRDNINGYTFTDVKAFPNQSFDNVPPSTSVTAQFKVLFPETLSSKLFEGGLYIKSEKNDATWVQPPYAIYKNLSSTGTLDITQGFDRTSDLSVIVNWNGNNEIESEYSIPFSEQYAEIVTISDVALAFAELNNRGINQNEVGNEFTYGIQFMNADVNEDGIFDSDDTYLLLSQVLEMSSYLEDKNAMIHSSKFYPKSEYNSITKKNYSEFNNETTLMTILDNKDNSKSQFNFESAITWKGDVNLSHSTTPYVQDSESQISAKSFEPAYYKSTNKSERQISSSIITELVDGKVVATISVDPKEQKLIGTQFKVKFDETKLSFNDIKFETNNASTNFSNLKNNHINIGSLIQIKDEYLDNKTKYVLTFTTKTQIKNTLGLVILLTTDAVNTKAEQLKLTIE